MKLVDLHIHSKYSLATSKEMILENIALFSHKKGITHVATGDILHPEWLKEIEKKLFDDGSGFFELKGGKDKVKFILSGEVSLIFGDEGSKRKVHILLISPSIREVKSLVSAFSHFGKLNSNGRPILKISLKEFSRIIEEETEKTFLIPAHIWTPHYSIFGSNSGFNSLGEAFSGDVSERVIAMETGLSSDPPMNWKVKDVMKYRLISNSDSHSPYKIGRELNVFDDFESFDEMIYMIKSGSGFMYTVEYFPEEGKYHYDGHRKCGVSFSPDETEKAKGICPVCGKKLTCGVLNRVYALSKIHGEFKGKKIPFRYAIPLIEVISKITEKSEGTKTVKFLYFKLVNEIANEFKILFDVEEDFLRKKGYKRLSEALEKIRNGHVRVSPGYDGVYGKISF